MSLFAGSSFNASLAGFQAPEYGPVARHYVAVRQNGDSSDDTIDMFIDNYYSEYEVSYAASVINACRDMTTLALQCTAGPSFIDDLGCGSNAPVYTVTHASDLYSALIVTEIVTEATDVTMTLHDSCAIAAMAATCSADADVEIEGSRTSTSIVATFTGSAYTDRIYPVEITGGAEKLTSPTATCGAVPAFSVRNIAWGLAGAVGIAGFLVVFVRPLPQGAQAPTISPTDVNDDLEKKLASLALKSWPQEWRYGPRHPDRHKEAFAEHYEKLDKMYCHRNADRKKRSWSRLAANGGLASLQILASRRKQKGSGAGGRGRGGARDGAGGGAQLNPFVKKISHW
ncbi:hypothetical protein DL770_010032 [Monosporascus sp. CRB-9-2]|nr:hypothetical protein DL770_010032 [Monosporascus sp. CRB-9-2]